MDDDRRKRLVVVAGSLALTALFAWLAFMLGGWGFDTRRFMQHDQRLRELVKKKPRLEQVVQGLNDEGSPLLGAPGNEAELSRLIPSRASARAAEVLEKARRWPQVRVHRAGDMLYFLYFDADGILRDYAALPG